jgi:hypothetical protein
MTPEPSGADVEVNAFGVKANVRNVKSLNTIITIAIFAVALLLAYGGWVHTIEAKDSAKELANELKAANKEVAATLRESNKELGVILKDLSQGIREQNCITVRVQPGMTSQQRIDEAQFCKRITR